MPGAGVLRGAIFWTVEIPAAPRETTRGTARAAGKPSLEMHPRSLISFRGASMSKRTPRRLPVGPASYTHGGSRSIDGPMQTEFKATTRRFLPGKKSPARGTRGAEGGVFLTLSLRCIIDLLPKWSSSSMSSSCCSGTAFHASFLASLAPFRLAHAAYAHRDIRWVRPVSPPPRLNGHRSEAARLGLPLPNLLHSAQDCLPGRCAPPSQQMVVCALATSPAIPLQKSPLSWSLTHFASTTPSSKRMRLCPSSLHFAAVLGTFRSVDAVF
jgi:hypothetical protein